MSKCSNEENANIFSKVKKYVKSAFLFVARLLKAPSKFWLFSKDLKELSNKKKPIFCLYNLFVLFLSVVAMSLSSLLLAYGPGYTNALFFDYLKNPYILLLNFLPYALLMAFFFVLFGKGWCAFLADGAITLGFSFANYFLLKFRDDPLMFSDVLYVREAADISKQGYDYSLGKKMILVIVLYVLVALSLFVFQGWKPRFSHRIAFVILPVLAVFPLKNVYFDSDVYNTKTANNEHIVQWSPTQIYVSKGFVYPFLHSIQDAFLQAPDGYDEDEAKKILSSFSDEDIEEDKKVNVIGIMLEAFVDLGNKGVEGISEDAYRSYRTLRDENYSGKLVTNIFGGGTIASERAFLTGFSRLDNYRRDVNSYVRYFNSQGYYTDGGHPSDGWFYNRQNVNSYLGFQNYRFKENYFLSAYSTDGAMRLDSNFLTEDVFMQYENAKKNGNLPYFSFNVTYQGHGPYATNSKVWGTDENPLFETDSPNVSEQSKNIVNNYLGSVKDTSWRLLQLVNNIKEDEEPIVLIFFGDHMPWLGDGNSAYNELGVNLDVSTYEGFMNYYSTEYVIVANDAAKEVLGNDFKGEGPTTSPCFLMNVLFNQLGWKGDAYMQYTDTVFELLPAMNDVGTIDSAGNFAPYYTLAGYLIDKKDEYVNVQFYQSTSYDEN